MLLKNVEFTDLHSTFNMILYPNEINIYGAMIYDICPKSCLPIAVRAAKRAPNDNLHLLLKIKYDQCIYPGVWIDGVKDLPFFYDMESNQIVTAMHKIEISNKYALQFNKCLDQSMREFINEL